MKKILLNGLILGVTTGVVNAVLALTLGRSILATPFQPGTTVQMPTAEFAGAAFGATLFLTLIGSLILWGLHSNYGNRGIKIWKLIGIIFLVLYGIFPLLVPAVASFKAAILVNIMHLVAGIPALTYLPKKL
ncbi:MAG: hypothetical protein AAFO07_12875 [Bacteroidota bacterium]